MTFSRLMLKVFAPKSARILDNYERQTLIAERLGLYLETPDPARMERLKQILSRIDDVAE